MSGFTIAQLHEIPRRDTWIPIRDHLGVGAFGVNAYRAEEAGGRVISDHTETLSKHEELYVVVEGHATFAIDGEEIDAPAGTLVFVGDPAARDRSIRGFSRAREKRFGLRSDPRRTSVQGAGRRRGIGTVKLGGDAIAGAHSQLVGDEALPRQRRYRLAHHLQRMALLTEPG